MLRKLSVLLKGMDSNVGKGSASSGARRVYSEAGISYLIVWRLNWYTAISVF